MSKFKAGDKVFWEYQGKKTHRVVSHQDGFTVWFTSGYWMHQDYVYFDKEDELPEVPESVLYREELMNGECEQYLKVYPHWAGKSVVIDVMPGGIALSPEDALKLSGDLLRMALKMRRQLDA